MKKIILTLLATICFIGCNFHSNELQNYVTINPDLQLHIENPLRPNSYLSCVLGQEFNCNWNYIYDNQDIDVDIEFIPSDSFEIISKNYTERYYRLKAKTAGTCKIKIISKNGTSSTSLPIKVSTL